MLIGSIYALKNWGGGGGGGGVGWGGGGGGAQNKCRTRYHENIFNLILI